MTTATPTRRRTRELTAFMDPFGEVLTAGAIVCVVEETDLLWPARTPGARLPRSTMYTLTTDPRTNQSRESRWEGWLGTTSNIDRWAEGAYEIRWIAESDRGEPWYRVSLRPVPHPASH